MSGSCDPMGYSPPGSSVHGIFQARILEWVAIPFVEKGRFSFYTLCESGLNMGVVWPTEGSRRDGEPFPVTGQKKP